MMLEGKTVLIAGVGDGLGREAADAAFREGANVLLAARTQAKLDEAAGEIDASGARVASRATDISKSEDCEALVAHGIECFGRIDALIQVAAYENVFGGIADTDFDNWRKAYETNVIGSMRLIRALAPGMRASGAGSIVLIGSQSMFMPQLPQAGYAASKSALLSAMYYLADELGPDGIRVNMVVPSWMWGPPVQAFVGFRAKSEEKTEAAVLDEIVGRFPLRRMTEDGEVADAAVFFASDRARAITGQHLMVNSGELMR
jgi:NAD(P)-dependent dehydrogenase (short-subunit alcohol dehydrogenase family)